MKVIRRTMGWEVFSIALGTLFSIWLTDYAFTLMNAASDAKFLAGFAILVTIAICAVYGVLKFLEGKWTKQ